MLQGYIPPNSFFNAAVVPSMPFLVIVAALLFLPGMRSLDSSRDPLATIDPPPPPIAATTPGARHGQDHPAAVVGRLRRVLRVDADVDPRRMDHRLQQRHDLSIVLLSITLITGMAGQLSLCQATLAGVGAFTAAQLANHLGLNLLVGGLVGAALAARWPWSWPCCRCACAAWASR